jgi:hypothetical protein
VLDWPWEKLGNRKWEKYGVIVINEQTAYMQPGNSHSSRQASMELLYAKLTGDNTRKENAIRVLNWATYMVDSDGKNFYPTNAVWMTDGYGDYVRHYLRAMAACPELAPDNANHILSSTSVVISVRYRADRISYSTYDDGSTEVLRITNKPKSIRINKEEISQSKDLSTQGWIWQPLDKGGVLQIKHTTGSNVVIEL